MSSLLSKVRKHRGFTLLEVLIGMSLLGVMMLLLLGSLRVCIQNWDAGEKKIAEVNRLAVIQRFFSTHLQNIRPLQDNFSDDEPVFSFQGSNNTLQFVSSMPASAGRMGLQVFNVSLERDASGESNQLMVAIAPFFPLMDGQEWKEEKVEILQNVEKIQFRYFGIVENDTHTSLQEDWLEKTNLPLLIGVSIEMADGEIWPEFIVAPKNEINKQVAKPAASATKKEENKRMFDVK